jgi:hypothetical protein
LTYVYVVVLMEEDFLVEQIHPNITKTIQFIVLEFFFLIFTSLFHVAWTLRIDGLRDLTSVEVFFNPAASSRDEDYKDEKILI